MAEIEILTVGIDWGNGFHQVCLVDAKGKRIKETKVLHTAKDLARLIDWLHQLSPQDHTRVHIGIETNQGTLVETLLLHEFSVFSCNPKQAERFRELYSPSGAKDDRLDAWTLANAIRTSPLAFRQVLLEHSDILDLREITRDLEQTKEDLRICTNRLWEQLHRYYAPLLDLCSGADEPWLWDLIHLAPLPSKGRGLHKETIAKLLRRHRIRRLSAEEVAAALRLEPLPVAPGVAQTCAQKVERLLARIQLLHTQMLTLTNEQKTLLAKLEKAGYGDPPSSASSSAPPTSSEPTAAADSPPADATVSESANPASSDVAILRSFPGVGQNVCATLLSEAGRLLSERNLLGLRGLSGVAAVTQRSGKSLFVCMRQACNTRLRNAMHHWAATAIQSDAHWRALYTKMRGQGHNYARALRGLGERLLQALFSALRSGTLYDGSRWPENAPSLKETATA